MLPEPNSPSWRSQVELWYLSYASLGVAAAGMAPILLPLVVSQNGDAGDVGLVMAAFSLGGLAAPLWGILADRYRLHRLLLIGGLVGTAAAMAAFPFSLSVASRLMLALIQGAAASAAGTVANLFIVENHPKPEWDSRIGWLQTFYGAGQVVGLLLAGVLSGAGTRVGLLAAAAIAGLGLLAARHAVQSPRGVLGPRPILRHPARHLDSSAGSPQRSYHYPGSGSLIRFFRSLLSPFGLMLMGWLVGFAGAAAFFALYPILMQNQFGVDPSVSAAGFAVAAGLGLLLYAPSGRWSERRGALLVLRAALAVRFAAFAGLFGLGFVHVPNAGLMAMIGFLFIVLAWSPLSITGTALAAQLSTEGEGEGLGLFNATTAVGGTLGAVLGGFCSEQWGFIAVPVVGILGVGVCLLILSSIHSTRGK